MASRRGVVTVGVLLFVGLLLLRGIPFLTEQREVIASTPTPRAVGLVSPLDLAPGSEVCQSPVTFSADSEVARVWAADNQRGSGPPLRLTATGPGYKATARAGGGYRAREAIDTLLRTPKHSLLGKFCIRNEGPGVASLGGTQEGRTVGRTVTTLDGGVQLTHLSLVLHRAEPASAGSRIGTLLAHDAALNPLSPLLVWILAIVTLLAVPFAVFRAFASSLAAADEPALAGALAPPPIPFATGARRAREGLAVPWARVRAIPGWAWLCVMLGAFGLWLFMWSTRAHTFQNDEAHYVALARWVDTALPGSLFDFTFINTGLQRVTIWLFAAVVGLFGGPTWVYVVHALQVGLFVSTAVPVYLLARGLGLTSRRALFAAFLTVVLPWCVLATSFLTEPVAYPAFMYALWAIWRSVTKPRWTNDLLAVALLVVAGMARVNLLGLVGVLAIAVVAQELRFGERGPVGARARAFVRGHWLLVAAALLGALLLVLSAAGVVSTDKLSGFYGFSNRFHVPTALLRSKLDVYTTRFVAGIAIVPFVFGAAWLAKTLLRPGDRERFAFALVGILSVAAIIYSSAGAGFDERYFIYFAPVFAIAFCAALNFRDTPPALVAFFGAVAAYLLLTQTWSTDPAAGYSWFVAPAETAYATIFL